MNRSHVLIAAAFTLAACGTSGDTVETAIQIRAGGQFAGPDGLGTVDQGGTDVGFDEARVAVRRIDLDLPDGQDCNDFDLSPGVECDDDDTIRIEGPWVVDLIQGTANPPLDGIAVPEGMYRRVDIRVDRAEGGLVDADDPLRDNSFYAAGTIDVDGGLGLELNLDFSEDARFEADDGIFVAADAGALIAELDVDTWLSGIPVADCIADGELDTSSGSVRIDEDTSGTGRCSDVENTLKDSIKGSGQLRSDDDED